MYAPGVTKQDVVEVLTKAGSMVTKETWIQGDVYGDGTEKFCALGAIGKAAGKVAWRGGGAIDESELGVKAMSLFADYIREEVVDFNPNIGKGDENAWAAAIWISRWNDGHAETATEVSYALYHAAEMIDRPEEKGIQDERV